MWGNIAGSRRIKFLRVHILSLVYTQAVDRRAGIQGHATHWAASRHHYTIKLETEGGVGRRGS
jgi:hypothetical protein